MTRIVSLMTVGRRMTSPSHESGSSNDVSGPSPRTSTFDGQELTLPVQETGLVGRLKRLEAQLQAHEWSEKESTETAT